MILWIFLFKVSKWSSVSEVLESRRVIGHDVCRSWDVGGVVAVAMLAGVKTGDVAEECSRAIAGDGTFGDLGISRCVVHTVV